MKKLKRPVAFLLAIVMLISMMNLTVFAEDNNHSSTGADGSAITEESVLICGLEESEGHTHDESCYTTEQVLTCEIPENHTHTIDCYEQSEMGYEMEFDGQQYLVSGLTCEIPEGHVHTDECYTEEQVLTCGLEESEGHTHTADCYAPVEPEAEVTETVEPETEVTEAVEPEPEVTEPVEPEPETTEPVKPEPETTEPVDPKPEVTEPVEPETEVTEPVEPEPEATESVDPEPEATELVGPEITEPAEELPEGAASGDDGIAQISISGESTVEVGGTITLTSDVHNGSSHKWTSSNDSIATVEGKSSTSRGTTTYTGVVTGVSPGGPVTITHSYTTGSGRNPPTHFETYEVTVVGSSESDAARSGIIFEYHTGFSDKTPATARNIMKYTIDFIDENGNKVNAPEGINIPEHITFPGPVVTIDENTFAEIDAPGFANDGAYCYFYWQGAYTGEKYAVTSVKNTGRLSDNYGYNGRDFYNSYLGFTSTQGTGNDYYADATGEYFAYNPTGTLVVVFVKHPAKAPYTHYVDAFAKPDEAIGSHEDRSIWSNWKFTYYPYDSTGTYDSAYMEKNHSHEGYRFVGWSTEKGRDGNGVKEKAINDSYFNTPVDKDVTLYAIWELVPGSLKITKTVDGGGDEAASKTYTFDVKGPEGYSETVSVTGNGKSITLENLVPGTYKVTEQNADITGYNLEVTGEGEVAVAAEDTAEVTVTNTYTQKLGSLKIIKILADGAPDEAKTKDYKFTVTKPDGSTEEVTITGADTQTLTGLVPGTYTVTEDQDGAKINGYTLNVTDGGTVTATVEAEKESTATITNTYIQKLGSLKIIKILADGAPDEAKTKDYKFTVTKPDGSTEEVTITGADTQTLTGLVPGTYTVTEDQDGAKINGYTLNVTDGGTVTATVEAEKESTATITNTYIQKLGSLKIIKILADGAPDEAKIKDYKFTVTKPDGSTEEVTITGEDTQTLTGLVPGTYTVTEDQDGAKINGYTLNVTDGGTVTATVEAEKESTATITNTYIQKLGSLKIIKILADGAPDEAKIKDYKFTVTKPDGSTEEVTITGEDTQTLTGLVPGTYTVTEDQDGAKINGYTLNVTDGGTVTATVEAEKESTATITNTYTRETGSLTITKKVIGGSEDAGKKNYTFIVTGSDNYEKQVTITGNGSALLTGLPTGKYTVTEQDASILGYDLNVTGGGTVTVKANGTASVIVTNTYKQKLYSFDVLKVEKGETDKHLQGAEFTLYKNKDCTEVVKSIASNGDGVATFSDIPMGTYYLKETKPPKNYALDDTVYTVTITDAGEAGQLDGSFKTNTGSVVQVNEGTLIIENEWKPENVTVSLSGTKTVEIQEGSSPVDTTFTFELKDADGNAIRTTNVTYTKNGGNNLSFTFEPLTFSKDDVGKTYTYTVTETQGNADGWTYDESAHQVTIAVTREGDELKAEVKGNEGITFTNTYKPASVTQTADQQFQVVKNLNGPVPSSDANSFYFVLVDSENSVKQIRIDYNAGTTGTQTANFAPLTFDHAGTYTYTIMEAEGFEPGYSYDTTYTIVRVEVVDKNGKLEIAGTTYTKSNGDTANAAEFTNTYNPKELTYTPMITKVIAGEKPSTNSTFNFKMELKSATTQNGVVMGSDEASVEGAGSASFGEIKIVSPGTYIFNITEDKGTDSHYTYDTNTVTLTLVVGIDKKGLLVLRSQAYSDNATFTNTYDPDDTTFAPEVSKIVEGDTSRDETFKFELKAEDTAGVEMPESTTATVTGDLVQSS